MVREVPKLEALPKSLPLEHAICIALQEGVPIFKASADVQKRIEGLLLKQKKLKLTKREDQELSLYEELDDYLSFANRVLAIRKADLEIGRHPPQDDPLL